VLPRTPATLAWQSSNAFLSGRSIPISDSCRAPAGVRQDPGRSGARCRGLRVSAAACDSRSGSNPWLPGRRRAFDTRSAGVFGRTIGPAQANRSQLRGGVQGFHRRTRGGHSRSADPDEARAGVSWGNWSAFVTYTRTLLHEPPEAVAMAAAIGATAAEITLAIVLLTGWQRRWAGKAAAGLLTFYLVAMAASVGFGDVARYALPLEIGAALLVTVCPTARPQPAPTLTTAALKPRAGSASLQAANHGAGIRSASSRAGHARGGAIRSLPSRGNAAADHRARVTRRRVSRST
jgi:hypothetical protein